MEELRVLFLAACPTDLDRLHVETEFKRIENALEGSGHGHMFDLRFVPAVGRGDLVRQLLKVRPNVLHFSGHGTAADELFLEDEDGVSEPLSAKELEELFNAIPEPQRPRVVVFSACYSDNHARAVTQVIECAIGIASEIHDSAALAFAKAFYGHLAQGMTVDAAVNFARTQMPHGMGTLPQLHVRGGAALAELQLIGRGPVSRFPTDFHIDRNEQIDCFRSMLDTGDPRVLMVTADGNMGKTRLVRTMARLAADHPHAVSDITIGAPSPEHVIAALATGVGADLDLTPSVPVLPSRTDYELPADPETAAARHRSLLQLTDDLFTVAEGLAVERGRRLVFLLDGLDDLSGDLALWVERIFLPRALQSDGVVCVLAGRAKPPLLTGFHLVREYQLSNFARSDVREAMELLHLDASDPVVRAFWVATDKGQPYVTLLKLEELWRDAIASMR